MSVLLLIVWTSVLPIPGGGSCPNGRPVGRIDRVDMVENQPIQIRKAGEKGWFRAEKGTELCVGDQVRTRYQTKGRIKLEAAARSKPLAVSLGVNSRVRTIGDWSVSQPSPGHEPVLDLVHGVADITFKGKDSETFAVRTGPSICRLRGNEVLTNWDPFKAEANHVVIEGHVSCPSDSVVVEANNGEWLEIIRGQIRPSRRPPELLREVFRRATTLR